MRPSLEDSGDSKVPILIGIFVFTGYPQVGNFSIVLSQKTAILFFARHRARVFINLIPFNMEYRYMDDEEETMDDGDDEDE